MKDSIVIQNLKIYANHGVLDFEAVDGQFFYVTATLWLDLQNAAAKDCLTDSIHYGEVCELITHAMQSERFLLIEAAAGHLINLLFQTYPALKKTELTIAKPSAPIGLPFENVSVTLRRSRHIAYVALGSNLGDREAYLNNALADIDAHPCCRLIKVSSFINTKPYGPVAQEDFLNACAQVETWLEPEAFLSLLLETEQTYGRVRTIHWGPRTLDLDLLLFDDEIRSTQFLTLPHPEMHLRRFVLEPLNEIAPFALHPLLNKRVSELYQSLPT